MDIVVAVMNSMIDWNLVKSSGKTGQEPSKSLMRREYLGIRNRRIIRFKVKVSTEICGIESLFHDYDDDYDGTMELVIIPSLLGWLLG
jgi:hypothetical protein